MAEPLLKAGERKKLSTALANCAACGSLIGHMKSIGMDVSELEQRKQAAEQLVGGTLEVDRMTQGDRE